MGRNIWKKLIIKNDRINIFIKILKGDFNGKERKKVGSIKIQNMDY